MGKGGIINPFFSHFFPSKFFQSQVETFLPGLREELFPDWQNRSNLKPVSSENVQNQNAIPPPLLDNPENTIPSEPKADAAPLAVNQSVGESNVDLATPSGLLHDSAPLSETPLVVDQRDETGSIHTGEGEEIRKLSFYCPFHFN